MHASFFGMSMLGSSSLRGAAGVASGSRPAQQRSVSMHADAKEAAKVAKPSPKPVKPPPPRYFINEIPGNGVWDNGIPPVMGAHLMASGFVAPLSTSTGAGMGVYPPKVAYFGAEGAISALLHATPASAKVTLAKIVTEAAAEAIKARGAFTLVLSGGSLFDCLEPLASAKAGSIQWDKVHVFFVDERVVPHDSPDSNAGAANKKLLSRIPIPQSQVHAIFEGLGTREAAVNYEGRWVAWRVACAHGACACACVHDWLTPAVQCATQLHARHLLRLMACRTRTRTLPQSNPLYVHEHTTGARSAACHPACNTPSLDSCQRATAACAGTGRYVHTCTPPRPRTHTVPPLSSQAARPAHERAATQRRRHAGVRPHATRRGAGRPRREPVPPPRNTEHGRGELGPAGGQLAKGGVGSCLGALQAAR
jgi:hypothetical protein